MPLFFIAFLLFQKILKISILDDFLELDHHVGQLHDVLAEARGHVGVVGLHPFHHLVADFVVEIEPDLKRGLDFGSVGQGAVQLAVSIGFSMVMPST